MLPTGSDTKRPIRKECRYHKSPAPRDGTLVRRSLLHLSRLHSAPHGRATSIRALPGTWWVHECSCLVHKVKSRSARAATARPPRGRRGRLNVLSATFLNYSKSQPHALRPRFPSLYDSDTATGGLAPQHPTRKPCTKSSIARTRRPRIARTQCIAFQKQDPKW